MKLITVFITITLVMSNTAYAANKYATTKRNCQNSEAKIERVNQQLRAGYSAKRGEYLRNELHELRNLKYSCRQNKLATKKD